MTKEAFTARAEAYGFRKTGFFPPDDGNGVIIMMLMPYLPYVKQNGPAVSAYYPASNRAYHACRQLADELKADGFAAEADPDIRCKPILSRFGMAAYGRNGLTACPPFGSRYAVACIRTDAPFEADSDEPLPYRLDESCAGCDRCLKACPTGALDGTGRVDLDKCVRAQPDAGPVKDEYRKFVFNSLMGCDICQDVCPRNGALERVDMPRELRELLAPEKLLSGDIEGLKPILGSNFARKNRIVSRALLVCANLGRKDLLPAVEELKKNGVPGIAGHAEWASKILSE